MTTTTAPYHTIDSLYEVFKTGMEKATPQARGDTNVFLRKAGIQSVLDAIGYKFPVDPDRKAFDAWVTGQGLETATFSGHLFLAFKAGRAMLRESMEKQRHSALDEIIPQTAKQPKNNGWIPWSGGECPVEVSQRVEVQYCGLEITEIACAQIFRWNHAGKPSDIIAYKIVKP